MPPEHIQQAELPAVHHVLQVHIHRVGLGVVVQHAILKDVHNIIIIQREIQVVHAVHVNADTNLLTAHAQNVLQEHIQQQEAQVVPIVAVTIGTMPNGKIGNGQPPVHAVAMTVHKYGIIK